MTERKPPTECRPDKVAGKGSATGIASGASPMDRFRGLAKGILGVSPEKVKAEQERYENEKKRPKD